MPVIPNTVVASAARTSSSQTSALTAKSTGRGTLVLSVNASTVTGTSPSMVVSVEWSNDGTTFYAADTADAFSAITATKRTTKAFTIKAPYYRVAWAITGTTPSFTFSVDAVQY